MIPWAAEFYANGNNLEAIGAGLLEVASLNKLYLNDNGITRDGLPPLSSLASLEARLPLALVPVAVLLCGCGCGCGGLARVDRKGG